MVEMSGSDKVGVIFSILARFLAPSLALRI